MWACPADCSLCTEPASVEAIGTWDVVFGVERTVPVALCRRHPDDLRDEVVLLGRLADRQTRVIPRRGLRFGSDGDERGPDFPSSSLL
jgi:hypothetical protein